MTRGYATIENLKAQGWLVDHEATTKQYRSAGVISPMKTRGNYEYCRVHHGQTVGRNCYQVTTVMKREVQ